ncbi:MAG: hypothetical protein RMI99_03890 [Nitrososphaerota archaeon]|nr:hypothetical protein [Candidatus Nezhaarchaeota archaeon]MDW8050191.1 hypothetical protein [Nitrososphaerota archaeon]
MSRSRAISSMIGIMVMAIMLSSSLALFSFLSLSFVDYATALYYKLEVASDIEAEEKLSIMASNNATHVTLTLTNRAPRDVDITYICLKHNESLHLKQAKIKIPPFSTTSITLALPAGYSNPLEVLLIAKRGSTHKISITSQSSINVDRVKIPYDDMCLINDVDVVDHRKGLVIASYKNGGVLMIDVGSSTILWSKEFLQATTDNVFHNEALNATIASISTVKPNEAKTLSILALRGGHLLSLINFYDQKLLQVTGSPTVRETIYQVAIPCRGQPFIIVPQSFFSANYSSSAGGYWLYNSRVHINLVDLKSPTITKLTVQSVLILDLYTAITPARYATNPDILPKLKVVGYVHLNESFGIMLVEQAFYAGGDIIYESTRCNSIKVGDGIIIPPTLHAIDKGSLSWYRSLYPCDTTSPSFLACIKGKVIATTGPYLYVLDVSGNILEVINFSPEKIVFLKCDEQYGKLIVQFTNHSLAVLNSNLVLEKLLALSDRVVEALLLNPSRIIVLSETRIYDPENPSSFAIDLPSKPYKAVRIGTSGILVATDHGLLHLKT